MVNYSQKEIKTPSPTLFSFKTFKKGNKANKKMCVLETTQSISENSNDSPFVKTINIKTNIVPRFVYCVC